MANAITRSAPCQDCGAEMLWTQNACHADDETRAAYRCSNGHTLDPSLTRQCPNCGVHDTVLMDGMAGAEGAQRFRCAGCAQVFDFPR